MSERIGDGDVVVQRVAHDLGGVWRGRSRLAGRLGLAVWCSLVFALGSASASMATAISAGGRQSCALTSGGAAKCWGHNLEGELGDGTNTSSNRPVDVVGLGSGVTAISAGYAHSCALMSVGAVRCWGNNLEGELGDGTNTSSNTPVNVVGLGSGVRQITTGVYHSCALTSGGAVRCWGDNSFGALGDGTNTSSNTPVDVVGLSSGVTAISAGSRHTCALMSGGAVKCWGYNFYGQLGDGTNMSRNTPVDVVGLSSGVTAISAGYYYTCALMSGGAVRCWGDNFYGQLGDGTNTSRRTPADVVGLGSGVTAINAGGYHACALMSGGAVKCWGFNALGELGDGNNANSNTPVDVLGLGGGVSAVSGGAGHTCAVATGGALKCWGWNLYGQLGDGNNIDSNTPVDVLGLSETDPSITATPRIRPDWPRSGQCKVVASFTDPDTAASASEYSATVAWGDGRVATNRQIIRVAPGDFRVKACHRYAAAGSYTVTITITDIDNPGNTATVEFLTRVA